MTATLDPAAPPASHPAPPVRTPRRRTHGALAGWLYATPTSLFVLLLSVIPVYLAQRLSSDAGASGGRV